MTGIKPVGRVGSRIGMPGVALAAAAAFGQQPAPPLQVVDQGVEDATPLSASLRDPRADLREPTDFERLYRVPGRPDLLMRRSGAMSAVFPDSDYAVTRFGLVPLVPAGTVWMIGDPSAGCVEAAKPGCRPHEALRLNPLPGPHRVRGRARVDGGSREFVATPPLARPVGAETARAEDLRVNTAVAPVSATLPLAEWERQPQAFSVFDLGRLAARDLTYEPYRATRIREIARRYGPGRDGE